MDITLINRKAWDHQVETGNPWTVPVSSEVIQSAREGDWQVLLTPLISVPRTWFPEVMQGKQILCLASGGGQQGPIFAAAGAEVTVFDNSDRQLGQDRLVAERDQLTALHTVQGDMKDLSVFADETFDLIFNPVSVCFIPDVKPVWKECARVLKKGGTLLTGFLQPHIYCLDFQEGVHHLRFSLPYSDLTSISEEERASRFGAESPREFSHTLTDLIGGQLSAGLHMVDIYEDRFTEDPINAYMPAFLATRSIKP